MPLTRGMLNAQPVWACVGAVLTGAAGAALLVHSGRGAIGTAIVSAWLQEQGVASDFRIERLDATGFTGAVRLGDPKAPDAASDHVELTFTPAFGLRSVRIVEPRVRARFDGRTLHFGTLQPLIDRALAAKPGGGPSPDISIERGLALMDTPAGPVRLAGDVRMAQGRLAQLDARLLPTRLAGADFAADVRDGALEARGVPGGVRARLTLRATSARYRDVSARDGALTLDIDAAGPGLLPNGPMRLKGNAVAGEFRALSALVSHADVAWDVRGSANGPFDRLSLDGAGKVTLRAAAAAVRGRGSATRTVLSLETSAVTFARDARRARLQAPLVLIGSADRLQAGAATLVGASTQDRFSKLDLQLGEAGLKLDGVGELRAGASSARVGGAALSASDGRANGRFAWAPNGASRFDGSLAMASGAPASQARRWAAAIPLVSQHTSQALSRISLSAPAAVVARSGSGEITLSAGRPIALSGAGGATLAVRPRGRAALLTTTGGSVSGALDLSLDDGGFPRARLAARRYYLSHDQAGLVGVLDGDLQLTGDAGSARGLVLDAAGRVERARGTVTARLARCTRLTLARYGAVASDVAATVCPTNESLFSAQAGRWRLAADVREARAVANAAQVALTGTATVTAHNSAGSTVAEIALAKLDARDLTAKRRFEPLAATGRLALAESGWRGDLTLASTQGRALGTATVTATIDASAGEVRLDTGLLAFKQDGFQPSAVSPLAPTWLSKLEGPARFTGRMSWREGAVDSDGRLETSGLDFTGPLGRVTRARGAVQFSSLVPLATPPGQALSADAVAWIAPLSAVDVTFQLTPDAVRLEAAKATAFSGAVRLDPTTVSLSPGATTRAVVRLAGVDIGDFISRSSLADKLRLQARLSGTLPLALGPEGVRFTDGRLVADGPGRISLSRKALTGTEIRTPGVQDLAYQALADLAFQQLDATVNSQPKGRLGVLFHVNGRHDPPTRAEARVGVFDLIAGKALNRPLDLPSDTPVNLTLDTSLNFDELLAAYSQAARGRSEPVQGVGAK